MPRVASRFAYGEETSALAAGPRPMNPDPSPASDPFPDPVPEAILDRAVEGLNLRVRTLREELGASATHVVFLRHFG